MQVVVTRFGNGYVVLHFGRPVADQDADSFPVVFVGAESVAAVECLCLDQNKLRLIRLCFVFELSDGELDLTALTGLDERLNQVVRGVFSCLLQYMICGAGFELVDRLLLSAYRLVDLGLFCAKRGGTNFNLVPLRDHLVVVHRVRTLEDAGQRVVVARGDGIEFMVVAAGASKRHAHEGASQRVELFVDDVHLHLPPVILGEHFGPNAEETGGNVARVPCRFRFVSERLQQVAGNLFPDKLVVRLVLVERINDIVAVAECVDVGEVFVEAIAVGIAGDVEPVATPFFAVMRRGQKPIDDPAECIRRFVSEEIGDFLHRWRKAGQVVGGPANESALGCGRCGLELIGLKPGKNEKVEILPWPSAGLHRGECRLAWPAEGPKLARLGKVDLLGLGLGQAPVARVGCTHLDPLLEVGDDTLGQTRLGRHHQFGVEVGDRPVEIALVRLAGDDRGQAGLTATADCLAQVEPQLALEFALLLRIGRVALVAVLDEDRPDFLFKKLDALIRRHVSRRGKKTGCGKKGFGNASHQPRGGRGVISRRSRRCETAAGCCGPAV